MKNRDAATQGRLEGILGDGEFGSPGAELSTAALYHLDTKYLERNEHGRVVESPRQMFARVAKAVAQAERVWVKDGRISEAVNDRAREFFDLMSSLKFLPGPATLLNAGRSQSRLSDAFELLLEDDLEKIYRALNTAIVVRKSGGRTAINFGRVRPKGDHLRGRAGESSGPIEFLKVFDSAAKTAKSSTKDLAILPVSHPDILEFLRLGRSDEIKNLELWVGVTSAFIERLEQGGAWTLINPRDGSKAKEVAVRSLWRELAEMAGTKGGSGVVFLRGQDGGSEQAVNKSCCHGSLNLFAYVQEKDLNWQELESDVGLAVRFLDDALEVSHDPAAELGESRFSRREIGLGLMGWADVLLEWGIPYDSDKALECAETVMKRIDAIALAASEELARERGAFPAFGEIHGAGLAERPRRNATVTSIGSTGSISIIAGTSCGIEPVGSFAYRVQSWDGEEVFHVHPGLRRVLHETGTRSRKAITRILAEGRVSGIEELPKKLRRVFRTAGEIDLRWHLRMQAAFQKHVDQGVAKTVNVPAAATAAEVRKVFETAYRLGCKSVRVHRDQVKPASVGKGAEEFVGAVEWLLDDAKDARHARKRVAVGLASLSRAQVRAYTKQRV